MIAGQQLAVWLAHTHPELLLKVARSMPRRLGDDGLVDLDFSSIGEDLAPLSSVTSAVDWGSFDVSPVLVDVTSSLQPNIDQIASSDAGIDFSSMFAAGGKAAGAVLAPASSPSIVSGVGSFLSTPTGIKSLTDAASNFFKAQAAGSQAQTAQAVLQTQISRATANQNPAPIGYAQNPYTGGVMPVLRTNNGVVPLSQPGLASLLPTGASAFLSQYGLWIGGAFLLVLLLNMRNRA